MPRGSVRVQAGEAAHWLVRSALKEGRAAEAADDAARWLKTLEKTLTSDQAAQLEMDRADALYEIPDRRSESAAAYAGLAAKYPKAPIAPQALYMAAFAALALGSVNDGSRRELAGLLRRVCDNHWPGLKAVLKEEASLWVELPDGWAISLEDGDAFWLARDDLLDAAADYIADRILDAEGTRRCPGNHPDPETPQVSDGQARDWAVDGLRPAGVEL